MTRDNFDSDWDATDPPHLIPPSEQEEDQDLDHLPPEVLRAHVENIEDIERDLAADYPGQSEPQRTKPGDPDEWHH